MPKIYSEFDGTKPFPKKSFTCDSFGTPTVDGRYIAWPSDGTEDITVPDKVMTTGPGGLLSKSNHNIAKIIIPHIRKETFNYAHALKNPIDLANNKGLANKLNTRVSQVLTKLGVNYADRVGVVKLDNEIASAAWFVDNGKEGIAINPYWVAKSDSNTIGRLIKKEIIHKALFRNLYELSNKEVLNFTLDVISMRIIAQTPYDKLDKFSVELSEQLFNPKIYKVMPFMALLDCSLTDSQAKKLPYHIYEIWASLYKPDEHGFLPSIKDLKPSALYFRIKALIDKDAIANMLANAGFSDAGKGQNQKGNYPFNIKANQKSDNGTMKDESISSIPDKKSGNIEKKVRESFVPKSKRYGGGFSNTMTSFWDEQVVHKKEFANDTLQEFSKKWSTDKLLEQVEGKIKDIIQKENVKLDPYPHDLTDEGIMMLALGVSGKLLPFFWNHSPDEKNNVKKVVPFIDLSPSMGWAFPYVAQIVNDIENMCDLSFMVQNDDGTLSRGAYGFAGNVRTIDENELEKMKKGQFRTGSSTSYQAVMEHVLNKVNNEGIDIVLCFTDSESSVVNNKLIEQFNQTGKKFYNIYFAMKHGNGPNRTLSCDLDKLNGESFTLNLPPKEHEE